MESREVHPRSPEVEDEERSAELEPPVAVPAHLFGALGGAVFVLDVHGRRLAYVDPLVERLLGYPPSKVLEDPELLRRSVHPDDAPRVTRALAGLLRDEVDRRAELRMIGAGGREVWIEGVASVVREGSRRYVVGAVLDITEKKRLEEVLRDQLEARVRARTARQTAKLARSVAERERLDAERRASEARFEAFAASAIEAIVIAGDDGKIAMVNARAEAMFGRSAAEMIGQPLTILMPPRYHEAHRRGLARYLETGESRLMGRTVELSALRADGSELPVELSLSSFRTPGGRPQLIGLLRDITERKQAEAELRRTNEELDLARREAEAATRAKSEFLANMSHDIRTPMNGVIGMAELLSYSDLSPRQREYVEMVRASADSLLRLLDDILDFSKIEAGRLELVPADFSLHDAIGEMLHPFAVQAAAKGLELAYHVSPEVPEVLVGDVHRLRQVVGNLVSNAIKFTQRGEIDVDVRASARERDSIVLYFMVRDTGIGIPSDQQRRIFEAFRQVAGRKGARPEGTGLGLAIAANVVEMMGGRIWVESEPGVGSTFHFTVRLGVGAERERPSRRVESLSGLHVLVVDDNAVNRLMLSENLARWGARPIAVADGEAALEALEGAAREDAPFELILLDSIIPGTSGIELARAVRARPAHAGTAILILSSAADTSTQAEQRELGISRVLLKPVGRSQLLEAIVEALGLEAGRPSERPEPQRTVEPMCVLVVDDNPINQRITAELLVRRGHDVRVAADGREALELIRAEHFDCVVMDVEMPVMDGLEATAALRARERETDEHLPVIAMTAYAMKGDRERMLAAGMDGYVAKPARSTELYSAVERYGVRTSRTEEPIDAGATAEPGHEAEPALDLDAALARTGGSMDLLRELASLFFERRRAMLDDVREAVATKDAPRLRRAAHTLKGSVALFGAHEATRASAELERMGREGEEASRELVDSLERELARLEDELQRSVVKRA